MKYTENIKKHIVQEKYFDSDFDWNNLQFILHRQKVSEKFMRKYLSKIFSEQTNINI